jgi:hypothetical protein
VEETGVPGEKKENFVLKQHQKNFYNDFRQWDFRVICLVYNVHGHYDHTVLWLNKINEDEQYLSLR